MSVHDIFRHSSGPIATAARSGKEMVIEDPSISKTFKRAALAKEFSVSNIHIVPCKDGVLEYGTCGM